MELILLSDEGGVVVHSFVSGIHHAKIAIVIVVIASGSRFQNLPLARVSEGVAAA